uniref:Putative ovule protein n=1 Tax=Solanum chacoense TaxID=4108 RepID=A0A0V0HIU8_SOLCH
MYAFLIKQNKIIFNIIKLKRFLINFSMSNLGCHIVVGVTYDNKKENDFLPIKIFLHVIIYTV